MVSKGFDEKCLFLFSKESWKRLEEKIMANKIAERSIQNFSRWFFSSASEESTDQQGRTRIPQNLIEYAGLKKEVVIAGLYNRLEIWDGENWSKYKKEAEKNTDDIAEQLGKLGIY